MSRQEVEDRTLFCARCGISFIWSSEEQSAQAGTDNISVEKPGLCSGCRHLLPVQERERGLVKWYNRRKRYGFIARQAGADLFAHRSQLVDANDLRSGDLVEFGVQTDARGPAAREITLLSRSEKSTL